MSCTAWRSSSATMRPTFTLDQSSEKHSCSTVSVSLRKPEKKGLARARFVRMRNSVSVTRGICTGPAPPGSSRSTVRRPCRPQAVGGLTQEVRGTSPALAIRSTSLCSTVPLETVSRCCTTSWSTGGLNSGSSSHARSSISAGLLRGWSSMPGATRSAASTWKMTSNWLPAGNIRAPVKLGGALLGARDRRIPVRKPSSEVKAQTALGSGSPGASGQTSSTRSQPSQAQQAVWCSSTSRSRRTSSSDNGAEDPVLRLPEVSAMLQVLSFMLCRPPPTRVAALLRGSPKLRGEGRSRFGDGRTLGVEPSPSGFIKPSASMVAALPTRCKP
mmetsp:Transcript_96617/g.312053  ORF Transcript_96617/g.312053 Transcript_96617/m.312053 type:complete len:329 (-) Transcript_96617:1100-2086(-)